MAVMSKLSIRARNVDSNKNLPIIRSEDLPDLNECSILPKNVTLFSTGMEKEEEEETHLQEALSALQFGLREKEDATSRSSFIPIPESNIGVDNYQELYSTTVKFSKQYIQYREKLPEETIPDYDADSEDEEWLEASFSSNTSKATLTKSNFEGMMEKLEKSSGQQVTSAADAKALLKGDDDVVMQVYDYWLAKRLRWRQALLPAVKVDRRDLVGDPYVAFRRRMDRVQTRKNRKNDEISYEKMLRLRKDFHRALEIIELMKERESTKHLLLGTEVDVVNLRKRSDEISNVLYREILQMVKIEMENREQTKTQSFASKPVNGLKPLVENNVMTERKRKKLRRDSEATKVKQDKVKSETDAAVKSESWDAPARLTVRQFAFKRDPSMSYQAASSVPESNLWPNVHLSYSLTNISTEGANQHSQNTVHQFIDTNRNIGHCRRRIGRGGRVMFDRIRYPGHLDFQATSDQLQLELDQQGCNIDTRHLPHEFWSHYLDHSYSIVCDSFPTEIPVYLPTAKRHQSLPPSCDLRAIGSFSTAEQIASAVSYKPAEITALKLGNPNKKYDVAGAEHAASNGTWSLANGSQGMHKTETSTSFQTAMLENVSDNNISYHNMVANCKKAQSPHSQFNCETESGQIFDAATCNGMGGVWMENQSTERPNNLRDNQTFLSHKRSVSIKAGTKQVIRGSKTASTGPALMPTTGSMVLDSGARNVEVNINRRGSNTAALLLNGEKGFGQVVPMQQQQIHFNYTAPEYWVNNNNKSEVPPRMPNGGIDHEVDGNLLMPQAKQSQTQLQVYKASQMSSVTKNSSASLQPSNVVTGNAPRQHGSLTSFTGSLIS